MRIFKFGGLAAASGIAFTALAGSASAQVDIELIAGSDAPAPGGGTYADFNPGSQIDDSGVALFAGRVDGVPPPPDLSDTQRIWSGTPGNVNEVLRNGIPAPGTVTSGEFSDFRSLSRARNGRSAFGAGVTIFGDPEGEGLWELTGPTQTPAATTFGTIGLQPRIVAQVGAAGINSSGRIAAKVGLDDYYNMPNMLGPLNMVENTAIAFGDAGSLAVVLESNEPAPGFGPDVFVDELLGLGAGDRVAVGDDGMIAFKALLIDDSEFPFQVLYAGYPDAFMPVAVEGLVPPGVPDFVYQDFDPAPAVSPNGLVAFIAALRPFPPIPDGEAIFAGAPGSLAPVVRSGETPPGALGPFVAFHAVAINASGDVAFLACEELPSEVIRPSLWIKRAGETPVLVAAVGTQLPTPSGTAAADSLSFGGHGAFSSSGQLVFEAFLDNKGSGVYRAGLVTPPPPPPPPGRRLRKPLVRITAPNRRGQVTLSSRIRAAGFVRSAIRLARVEYATGRSAQRAGLNARSRTRTARISRAAPNRSNFSFRERLRIGRNTFTITATDVEGNRSVPVRLIVVRYRCDK